MENATNHTHEIIELKTGDVANVAVGCTANLSTEHGTQSSCLTGNDVSNYHKDY